MNGFKWARKCGPSNDTDDMFGIYHWLFANHSFKSFLAMNRSLYYYWNLKHWFLAFTKQNYDYVNFYDNEWIVVIVLVGEWADARLVVDSNVHRKQQHVKGKHYTKWKIKKSSAGSFLFHHKIHLVCVCVRFALAIVVVIVYFLFLHFVHSVLFMLILECQQFCNT